MTGWRLNFWSAALVSLLVSGGLVFLLAWRPGEAASGPLTIHCAVALQPPVEAIAREYEQIYKVPIRLNFGPSQALIASIANSGKGDLYIPADDSFIELARRQGQVDEALDVAVMHPVLAVKKGNPKKIESVDDLARPGIRFAQANPDAAAIGKLTRDHFRRIGQWQTLDKHTAVYQGNVNEVANAVLTGPIDAGIVWDAMVAQMPGLEAVKVPGFSERTARVMAGVLKTSERPNAALRFARYLAARDKGLTVFAAKGYQPAAGDEWAEEPRLIFFGGAMLKPAVEQTLTAFEQREGVKIVRKYNPCGLLLGDMIKIGGDMPDAYFACDTSFFNPVRDRFGPAVEVSRNRLVILVAKGNPKGIRVLADLARPGLEVGLADEKQSALGKVSRDVLEQTGLYDRVVLNRKTTSLSGDYLVNQMAADSLDAAIVYASNAAAAKGKLDTVPIDVASAFAVQPVAVARETRYPNLANRLLEALRSKESKDRFEAVDFQWGPVER